MTETVFLHEGKESALEAAVAAVRGGLAEPGVLTDEPESFQPVPGTPFACWVAGDPR